MSEEAFSVWPAGVAVDDGLKGGGMSIDGNVRHRGLMTLIDELGRASAALYERAAECDAEAERMFKYWEARGVDIRPRAVDVGGRLRELADFFDSEADFVFRAGHLGDRRRPPPMAELPFEDVA